MTIAPRSAGYLALLVGLASFGPVTMSIYTPVMPSVGVDLHTTAENVKYTLTNTYPDCTNGQLVFTPPSPAAAGTTVTMTGSADCTGGTVDFLSVSRIVSRWPARRPQMTQPDPLVMILAVAIAIDLAKGGRSSVKVGE